MKLEVIRYSSSTDSTLGMLMINGEFGCYTLEDEKREVKVLNETRIPAGTYSMKLRTFGTHHTKYAQMFPQFHKGMLEIENVPNFTDILIHIGNTDEDTAGCLLVGDKTNNNNITSGQIMDSKKAYQRIYPKIANAIAAGEKTTITYRDSVNPEVQEQKQLIGIVDPSALNLRIKPEATAFKEGILTKATPVKILEEKSGWFEVQVTGWVKKEYLRV